MMRGPFCGSTVLIRYRKKGLNMQVASFDDLLEFLKDLDPWLLSLGIKPKNDRWHEALKIAAQAQKQLQRIGRGETRRFVDNYISGLFDAAEIHDIFKAFGTTNTPALQDKVLKAVSGPIAPLSEQPSNSKARNAMFELSLAADWKNGGAYVILGEPDIEFILALTRFLVECKRPFYDHSVRGNIKEAASQLGSELDKPGRENDYGIVAISLSRTFTQGDLVCFADEREGRAFVNATLQWLIDENREAWGVNGSEGFHERIVAVMFHLAVPWDMNGQRLVHTAMANFVKVGNSAGWDTLTKNLPSIY
jgi:hypothetical protein